MGAKPRIRTPENAQKICDLLAEGFTLRQVAKELNCDASAITTWVREDNDFAPQYARAMDLRWERMAEEIQEISDEGTNDWMEREGLTTANHEHISRSKLRVDTRKWLLSKMMPKKYGDRLVHAGDPDAPLKTETAVEVRVAAVREMLDAAYGEDGKAPQALPPASAPKQIASNIIDLQPETRSLSIRGSGK